MARATPARSIAPSRPITSAPRFAATVSRTSSRRYRSCTTASASSTAQPCRANAARAVDLPAPIVPVSPISGGLLRFAGILRGLGRRGLVRGLVGLGGGGGRLLLDRGLL